jgi:hypothetical protein
MAIFHIAKTTFCRIAEASFKHFNALLPLKGRNFAESAGTIFARRSAYQRPVDS